MESLDLLAIGGAAGGAPVLARAEGGTMTYGALRTAVGQCRMALDYPAKALVLVGEPRSLAGLTGYLAALAAGHAIVLGGEGGQAHWPYLLALFQPELVIAASGQPMADVLRESGYRLRGAAPFPVWCRTVQDGTPAIHPELGLIARTSGSLGPPKLVRLSFSNLRANAEAIAEALALRDTDRTMTALPMDFSFGLSLVNSALAAGASIALSRYSPSSTPFWDYLDQVAGTCVGAVPTTYTFLRATGWVPGAHTSLRLLLHAGGALDDGTLAHYAGLMAEQGGEFVSMYGMTEATARISCLRGAQATDYRGSAGLAIPGNRITVVGLDRRPAPDGDTGEIVVEGPGVMMGYASSRADLADGDRQGPVLPTGDLGYLRDGFVYITGRKDRRVKVFGRRVDLDQVERQLSDWGVTAAAEGLSADCLAVVAEPGDGLSESCRKLSRALGLPFPSVRLTVVSQLPSNDHGKIDRRAVRHILTGVIR